MTAPGTNGVIESLDLRGLPAGEASRRLKALLASPPASLAGLLVIDQVTCLLEHDELYERAASSRQIPGTVVVALGPLPAEGSLVVPAYLQGEGSSLLWVGDPVGVIWGPASSSADRLTAPTPEHALERLLSVLRSPAVFEAVCRLPGPRSAAPGLALLGGSDGSSVVRAQIEALDRLAGPGRSGPVPVPASDALQGLRAATEAPPGAQVIVDAGPLGRRNEEIRYAADDCAWGAAQLTQPWGLVLAARRAPAVRAQLARAGSALGSLRAAALELRRGVQAPGGGYELPAVEQRCTEFGLRRMPPGGSGPTGPGRLVGDMVTDWLRRDTSLSEVEGRLQTLEQQLSPRTSGQYTRAVDQACPAELVQVLTLPPPGPKPPGWLFATAAVAGLLAGIAPSIGGWFAVLVVLAWAGLLACWPSERVVDRVGLALAGGAAAAGGGALGVLLGGQLGPPAWLGAATVIVALVMTVVLPALAWQRAVTRWLAAVPLAQVSRAQVATTEVISAMVRTEWAALDTRQRAVDTLTLARTMVLAARLEVTEAAQNLRREQPAAPVSDVLREYWQAVAQVQARSLVLGVFQPMYDRLTGSRTEDVQRAVTDGLRGALCRWAATDGQQVLRGQNAGAASVTTALGEEAVDALLQVVSQDPGEAMWQLTDPDDVIRLSSRLENVSVVRFAPAVLPDPARRRLPVGTVLTAEAGLAGVLRLVGLREGTVTQAWRTAQPAEGSAADGRGVQGGGLR